MPFLSTYIRNSWEKGGKFLDYQNLNLIRYLLKVKLDRFLLFLILLILTFFSFLNYKILNLFINHQCQRSKDTYFLCYQIDTYSNKVVFFANCFLIIQISKTRLHSSFMFSTFLSSNVKLPIFLVFISWIPIYIGTVIWVFGLQLLSVHGNWVNN